MYLSVPATTKGEKALAQGRYTICKLKINLWNKRSPQYKANWPNGKTEKKWKKTVRHLWNPQSGISDDDVIFMTSFLSLMTLYSQWFFKIQGGHVITSLPGATPMRPGAAVRFLPFFLSVYCLVFLIHKL